MMVVVIQMNLYILDGREDEKLQLCLPKCHAVQCTLYVQRTCTNACIEKELQNFANSHEKIFASSVNKKMNAHTHTHIPQK